MKVYVVMGSWVYDGYDDTHPKQIEESGKKDDAELALRRGHFLFESSQNGFASTHFIVDVHIYFGTHR